MNNILIKLNNITKQFPGVVALDDVSMEIRVGEVHALVGENGAGKSTLIKILSGIYPDYSGKIFLNGSLIKLQSPKLSQGLGFLTIFQELSLCSNLSVAENIFLGHKDFSNKLGLVSWNSMYKRADDILKNLNAGFNSKVIVSNLSIANQQIVEIAKALSKSAKLIIMDEPTSSLSKNEIEVLFKLIRELQNKGITILYVSHKMDEVFEISDSITVLRDGKYIGTFATKNITTEEIVKSMVGRELSNAFPKTTHTIGEKVLEVKNFTRHKYFLSISFSVREGEILGIAGLIGAGRTELVRCIFGVDKVDSGELFIKDKKVKIQGPIRSMENGIGFIPEDRKEQGLVLCLSVGTNISLSYLYKISPGLIVNQNEEDKIIKYYIDSLRIKTPSSKQLALNLSGGNQQKVVVAKWLATKSNIMIFDEPTRGIDVGAKAEIYSLMNTLVENGVAIIMINSEMNEILAMSDRIIVMHEGKFTGEFTHDEVTPEKIMLCATGTMKKDIINNN